MTYQERKHRLEEGLARWEAQCIALAADLGANPEISYEEYQSMAKIAAILREAGFEVEEGYGGLPTAFRAVRKPETPCRHRMAILTEYDALPGLGHACGHNVSGSVSVLAGLALADLQSELDTEIHVVGTPAEERVIGKAIMGDHGAWEGYDFAMMVHMDADNMTAPIALATLSLNITFKGRSAHASAAPWLGCNALNGARLTLDAIDMLRQHMRPGCQVHAVLEDGGVVTNIIPESCLLKLQLRAFTYAELMELDERIRNCARGAAIATETECSFDEPHRPAMDLKPNRTADRLLQECFEELELPLSPNRLFASTDAGNVSYLLPTLQPTMKIAPAGTGLHTPAMEQCARSEETFAKIRTGAELIGLEAIKVFGTPGVLEKVWTDFQNA